MVLCWATHGHSCCDCFVELLIAIAIITMAILVAHCFVDLPIGSALITMAVLLTVAFVELLLAIALLTMAFLVATSRKRKTLHDPLATCCVDHHVTNSENAIVIFA